MNDQLNIDLETSKKIIIEFIRNYAIEHKRGGAVVGLSGGIDSALVLKFCVEALGSKNVLAIMLPERDSNPANIKDAIKFAKVLDVKYIIKKLTPLLSLIGIYRLYPPSFFFTRKFIERHVLKKRESLSKKTGKDLFIANIEGGEDKELSKGIAYYRIKHRIRATILFYYSELNNYLLAGCANKSEWFTGFFVKYGDSIADIMPIIDLYKTQVFKMAEYLGIPDYILNKAPSPDLIPGLEDEDALGITYKKLDLVLEGLEKGFPKEKITETSGASDNDIERVLEMINKSEVLRKNPIFLKMNLKRVI
ncbi:MAG: NAD(+) synthase [Actinobacteria bacterium]|nr:NAD(+) synthase [Actinomycetota bacterium]